MTPFSTFLRLFKSIPIVDVNSVFCNKTFDWLKLSRCVSFTLKWCVSKDWLIWNTLITQTQFQKSKQCLVSISYRWNVGVLSKVNNIRGIYLTSMASKSLKCWRTRLPLFMTPRKFKPFLSRSFNGSKSTAYSIKAHIIYFGITGPFRKFTDTSKFRNSILDNSCRMPTSLCLALKPIILETKCCQ